MNYPVMESLIKVTIKNANEYKLQSLAVIANSLGQLDIKNQTIFTIIKNIILKEHLDGNTEGLLDKLKPIDCAQFMTAFCRVSMFDLELFEALEGVFVKKIDQTSAETLVTMFTSHAAWSQNLIEECLVQKKHPRRLYNYFRKYNEEFYEHLAVNLIRKSDDINLKGAFLVLAHGNMAHLKRRQNMRLMRQFAVKSVQALKDEKTHLGSQDTFELMCAKYYEYASKYCLNK